VKAKGLNYWKRGKMKDENMPCHRVWSYIFNDDFPEILYSVAATYDWVMTGCELGRVQ